MTPAGPARPRHVRGAAGRAPATGRPPAAGAYRG